jgi:hypothetical protein
MPSTPFDPNDFAPPVRPPPPTVPQGWTVRWDSHYNRWFYVNLATKQSQVRSLGFIFIQPFTNSVDQWEAPPGTTFPDQPPPYSGSPVQKSNNLSPRPEPYRAHSSPHPISASAGASSPAPSPAPTHGSSSGGGLGSALKSVLKAAKQHKQSRPHTSSYYTTNPYYGGGMMGRPMYGGGYSMGGPMMMGGGFGGRRPGMGAGGAAALGLGGGLLGGMMLNDAMNDEWRDGYQDAMQDQGDYGGGFDGGDFGGGDFGGGDFGGDF